MRTPNSTIAMQLEPTLWDSHLPQAPPNFPMFLAALHRKVRKIMIFTPPPSCAGYLSRCMMGAWCRSGRGYADHSHSASVCLGDSGGFSLPGYGLPLSGGHPRYPPAAGAAAGPGTWTGRLSGLCPLGRRRADPPFETSLL